MKRDRLKPYVYKVEGAVNFALYNMLSGKFYHFSPDGTVEELRKQLLEEGLIFETEGIVPNKVMRQDMWDIQKNIQLRILQVRLNGRGEDNCWNRAKNTRERSYTKPELLDRLLEECRHIPIHTIRIEAEEEDFDNTAKILKEFKCKKIELYIEKGMNPKTMEEYRKSFRDKEIVNLNDGRRKIKDLKVAIFNFFYSKHYNPCLGHQVAIDCGGEIKCCLWSEEILGNIETDDLKDMIIKGKFDKYWEFRKDMAEVCKDCELRRTCDDCRVSALKESGRMEAKPPFCSYNPYTGE